MDLETHRELYKPEVTSCLLHEINDELEMLELRKVSIYNIQYVYVKGEGVLAIITHSKTAL